MKKLLSALTLLLVVTGAPAGVACAQETGQQVQETDPAIREYCRNHIASVANGCRSLQLDYTNFANTTAGRNFNNLYSDLSMFKQKNLDLKQRLTAEPYEQGRQFEIWKALYRMLELQGNMFSYCTRLFEYEQNKQPDKRDEMHEALKESERQYYEAQEHFIEISGAKTS